MAHSWLIFRHIISHDTSISSVRPTFAFGCVCACACVNVCVNVCIFSWFAMHAGTWLASAAGSRRGPRLDRWSALPADSTYAILPSVLLPLAVAAPLDSDAVCASWRS